MYICTLLYGGSFRATSKLFRLRCFQESRIGPDLLHSVENVLDRTSQETSLTQIAAHQFGLECESWLASRCADFHHFADGAYRSIQLLQLVSQFVKGLVIELSVHNESFKGRLRHQARLLS